MAQIWLFDVVEFPNPAMWGGESQKGETIKYIAELRRQAHPGFEIGAEDVFNKSHSGQPCLSIVAP